MDTVILISLVILVTVYLTLLGKEGLFIRTILTLMIAASLIGLGIWLYQQKRVEVQELISSEIEIGEAILRFSKPVKIEKITTYHKWMLLTETKYRVELGGEK